MLHGELLHLSPREGTLLRRLRPAPAAAERLAAQHRALGDATRLTLALALRDQAELCVCDLSWIIERAQNLTSHHMRVLREAGLVAGRREGKMTMYSLTEIGRQLVEAAAARG